MTNPLFERSKAIRDSVESIRDNPEGAALSRLIVDGISQARFEGMGEWDQARYVAHLALEAGWRPQVTAAPEPDVARPFMVGDWVLVTLPRGDQAFKRCSGRVGRITHTDDQGGFAVAFDGGTGRDDGVRAVTEELTLVTAPVAEPEEAEVPANA